MVAEALHQPPLSQKQSIDSWGVLPLRCELMDQRQQYRVRHVQVRMVVDVGVGALCGRGRDHTPSVSAVFASQVDVLPSDCLTRNHLSKIERCPYGTDASSLRPKSSTSRRTFSNL